MSWRPCSSMSQNKINKAVIGAHFHFLFFSDHSSRDDTWAGVGVAHGKYAVCHCITTHNDIIGLHRPRIMSTS